MNFISFLFALCFLCLGSPLLVFGQGQNNDIAWQNRNKLDSVSKQIEKMKNDLKTAEQLQTQVISKLNEIEIQLQREGSEKDYINGRIEAIQNSIHESTVNLTSHQAAVSRRESYLCSRLSALYKYNRRSGLRILLSASTYNDIFRLESYLGSIVEHDTNLLNDSMSILGQSKIYHDELNARHRELVQAKADLLQKTDEMKQTRQDKLALLTKIKKEKSLQIEALNELELHSQKLQEVLDRLPQEKRVFIPSGNKFSGMRGKLMHPIKGKLITTFGRKNHAALHTFTFQKGIEIEAAIGSEIKAVFDGKVVFADWFKGYGYTIIIDHGESYYSLSAHASALLKNNDDIVSTGETIALVGDTASMKGSCVYFEIRHHGKPLDPLKWLKKAS